MNNPDNTLIQFADNPQTMTSLEIAEVTGKNHFDVLKAIRKMEPAWEKVQGSKFACLLRTSDLPNGGKKENPYYVLTKTETLYIATKFNDEARARLVIRWEQLEHEHRQPGPAAVPSAAVPRQPPVSVIQQPSRRQILLMALQAEEECQRLIDQNSLLQANMLYMSLELGRRYQIIQQYAPEALPLVHTPGYEPWQNTQQTMPTAPPTAPPTQTYTATQLAREYGMKAISFNNLLQQLGVQYLSAGQWLLAPDYAGRGYTLTKHVTVHDQGRPQRKPFTVWTQQGRQFLHDRLKKHGILPLIERQPAQQEQTQKGGTK